MKIKKDKEYTERDYLIHRKNSWWPAIIFIVLIILSSPSIVKLLIIS
jgi:hypothetical protein